MIPHNASRDDRIRRYEERQRHLAPDEDIEASHKRMPTDDLGAITALYCDVRTLFIGKINSMGRQLIKEARIQKHFEKSDLIFKYNMYGQVFEAFFKFTK